MEDECDGGCVFGVSGGVCRHKVLILRSTGLQRELKQLYVWGNGRCVLGCVGGNVCVNDTRF